MARIKSLGIVIPTYNGSHRIQKTLKSIHDMQRDSTITLKIYLIDNNSDPAHSIEYKNITEEFKSSMDVHYMFEPKQGRSHALNTGISASPDDVLAFVDDDETVDASWANVILKYLSSPSLSYIGGACLPNWHATPPRWLPAHEGKYRGVLGWIELSDMDLDFNTEGIELCGGNFAIKRSDLIQAGAFNTSLGRSSNNLMGGEDGDLHRRLKNLSLKGVYTPSLIIYHDIPTSRMTFKYHSRWSFWSGFSHGVRLATLTGADAGLRKIAGIPLYLINKGLRGALTLAASIMKLQLLKDPVGACGLMDASYSVGVIFGRFSKTNHKRRANIQP